ncbi:MAG: thiamine pyrophosphate-binding protein [Deltaproteobacteria bacterium]|nr:thiamine pyrophosphate-binding protein [Deltaproteobacteria bacterium]
MTTSITRRGGKLLLSEEVPVREAIVCALEQAGIDMVFGMPGGNAGQIYNALYDHKHTIRTVLVREEPKAGVMAEVYGRLTGKPGVALAQGAFLAGATMGAIEGHLSSSPMLLLGDLSDHAPFSLHGPYQSGAGEYGTWDAKGLFSSITKQTFVALNPAHAVQCTQLAIKHALTGERGPVAVLYHSQALRGRVGPDTNPPLYATEAYLPGPPPAADVTAVEQAACLLAEAERPVIIAGNGVRVSRAYSELVTLAEQVGAAVATTAGGKGTFAETHDLALGTCGNFGTPLANALIGAADVVLVIGSKLGVTDTVYANPKLLDPRRQTLIQIDIEPKNVSWTIPAEVALAGDAKVVLTQLLAALAGSGAKGTLEAARARVQSARQQHGFFNPLEFTSGASPILPQRAIKEIHNAVADDAIITCDAGENRIFMTHFFQTKDQGTFLQPAGVGGMGYALPAALAAKLVHPQRQVIAVSGDGGFGIAMNALMTAIEERIPIVNVVLNNQALGWVKHGQGERNIACDFANFDHAGIARAMGCQGIRVEDPRQLAPALNEALTNGKPTVVDVRTSLSESFVKVTSPLMGERS